MTARKAHPFGCKLLCLHKYNGMNRGGHRDWYAEGYVFCGQCQRFMKKHNRYFCLCCGKRVRVRAANAKLYREKHAIQLVRI